MLRKTPSLEATEAFLFAGRCESFRAAAGELALSPSAFSRRIQQLERFVGVALFDRSGPGVRLTQAGRRYLDEIAPAMDIIRRATAGLSDGGGPVRLATSHSFALSWLMPRLPGLLRSHDLEIELLAGRGVEALRRGEADIVVCGGAGVPAEFPSEVLIRLEAVVASAPVLWDVRRPPGKLEELGEHRLLGTRTPPNLWGEWLSRAGVPPRGGETPFDTIQLMYEAAAGGLGLVLAAPIIAERFLQDRRLEVCFNDRWPLGMQYSLLFADAQVQRRTCVRRFADWLREEVRWSAAEFDRLSSLSPTGAWPPSSSEAKDVAHAVRDAVREPIAATEAHD